MALKPFALKLFIDRLHKAKEERIQTTISSAEVLDSEDVKDLGVGDILVELKAYMAGCELVIEMDRIEAKCRQTCIICSEPFIADVVVENTRHLVDKDKIKGAVFNAAHLVREDIMLALEDYPECGGNCPERTALKQFLK